MNRLQGTLHFIQAQLGRLQPAHKLLIGSALVVVLMGLLLARQYAGERNFVLLPLGDAPIGDAAAILSTAGIAFEERPEGLYIDAGQRARATGVLSEKRLLGADASKLLYDLIREQPWWANRQQNNEALNAARGRVLGQIISEWSGIRFAEVMVSASLERPGLGRPPIPPTASVIVDPVSGALTQEQAEAIADFVAGAIPNLDREQIRIVDRSRSVSMRARSSDSLTAGSYMELLMKVEEYYEDKIRRTLPEIPQVVVTVNAVVDHSPRVTSETSYAREGRGSESFLVEERTESMDTQNSAPGGDPGTRPNTSTSAMGAVSGSGGGGSNQVSRTRDETRTFEPKAGVRSVQEQDPAGRPTRINATVRIPRSFIERIWTARNPSATTPPDDAALETLFDEQRSTLESEISNLIDTAEPYVDPAQGASAVASLGAVKVGMYYDFDMQWIDGSTDAAAAGMGTWLLSADGRVLGIDLRDLILAGFTLMSLFMLFRIVRGATVRRELPSAEELVGIPPSLRSETDELIGEADVSDPPMDALEVDDEDIRAAKLVEQVEELVGTNPKETAKLVSRWALPE